MDVNEILSELETLKNAGTRVPGFRGKIMVESDKLVRLSESIKSGMPADIEEAQAIIMQKDGIISQAYLEANRVREESENTAQELSSAASVAHEERVSDSEIIKEASSRGGEITANATTEAQSIVQDARRKAYSLLNDAEASAATQREGADRYSREVLAGLEEKLAEVLSQVRRGIDTLRPEGNTPSPRNGVSV